MLMEILSGNGNDKKLRGRVELQVKTGQPSAWKLANFMTYIRQIAHLKNMVNNIYLKVIFNNFEWHKENNFINLKVLMCVLIMFVILPNQHKSQESWLYSDE